MRTTFSKLAGMAALLAAAPASACTLCYSRTAIEVRATVLGDAFWPDVAALLAPVPILLAAVWLSRRLVP